ncbi:low molecular weight protein-tyrosine-phosphatase [Ferviditalea candida]|uniref:protein-tyrosine-phosphatase n=1 Tax=Ferviditalea candida TaxID=3108399 RepID=A0ABU5ZIZ7_9BACL|nr:low molecular weight protein-tyrosine-phosphatase [Paenibacillaceae bacterium T2]
MIKVLFVCLGNICRSPMAEAVFRGKVRDSGLEGLIEVDSAGTGSWHVGEKPHAGTRKILRQKRIDDSGIEARQVRKQDFSESDYIIAMDSDNARDLIKLAGGLKTEHVSLLLDFLPESEFRDVPDPYYSGNFQIVYELIDRSCDHLLQYIREREQI